MSSVALLGPHLLVYKDHCTLPLMGLEKQSRPGHVRGHLRIQRFSEDLSLCPVAALSEYNNRVQNLNPTRTSFFISFKKPKICVASKTLARWTMDLLSCSGVDTNKFKSHSTRAAAGNFLSRSLTSIQLCKLADWSLSSGTYQKFYERYV